MKQLLLLLFFSSSCAFAQCDTTNATYYPEIDAQFPGGAAEMMKFIQKNFEYPDIERCSLGQFTGKIYIKFIVCEDGSIINTICERGSGDPETDQKAIDFINKMPNWIPATTNDAPVASFVRLPITICLE